MRNSSVRHYLCLVGAALFLFSLPSSTVQYLRSLTSQVLAPIWRISTYQWLASAHPDEARHTNDLRQALSEQEKESLLLLENLQLREEVRRLLAVIDCEQELAEA